MLSVAIVDDDPDIRSLVRRWVTRDGHWVVAEAVDGAEGIDVAGSHRPDVLVLDIEMPILDGCYAIPGILRASPSTVIVVPSVAGGPLRPVLPMSQGVGGTQVLRGEDSGEAVFSPASGPPQLHDRPVPDLVVEGGHRGSQA